MKVKRKFKITGVGSYAPPLVITNDDLEQKLGLNKGWIAAKVGVLKRHHVTSETNTDLAVKALDAAMQNAKISIKDIDVLLSGAATFDYVIPNRSSTILNRYTLDSNHKITTFDINTTCLSFVSALDYASMLLASEPTVNRIAIVSSEIASKGLSPERPETFCLFGDAAAAIIIERTDEDKGLIYANQETYAAYAEHTIIRGGGNAHHPKNNRYDANLYSFEMKGSELLKVAIEKLPSFIERSLADSGLRASDLDWIIPHQASKMGIAILHKLIDNSATNIVDSYLPSYGNCIAASIPFALCHKVLEQKIRPGQIIKLIGTSAGMSIGTAILKF